MENTNYTRVKAFWQTLTICLFLGLLWLPTLDFFLKFDHARPPVEKRSLASWPAFAGVAKIPDYLAGIEKYFNDHFGCRNRLIRTSHQLKERLFGNPVAEHDVLYGRDGWLYFSGDDMMPNYLRESVWTDQDLEKWQWLLEQRRDWLKARGIKYLFVVAPDKHTVYPEHLPDWLPRPLQPSKVEQFSRYMKARSTVPVLDLSSTLIDAKKIRQDYLKTDTHWNSFGALVACRALCETLSQQLPALKPLPLDFCDWKPVQPQPTGDLTTMSGLPERYPETDAVMPVGARPPWVDLVVSNDPAQYTLLGTKKNWLIYTLNTHASGTAIVFRDSFAEAGMLFLGQHFRKVIYVWQHEWDHALIEKEQPDAVIDEMVERSFNLETFENLDNLAEDKPVLRQ